MLAIIVLVVLSPLALSTVDGNVIRADWSRLSSIGATYGAVSAVVAAIALVGVVTSLIIQSREAKATRSSALRALHIDLLRMAMEDPVYMECWGTYLTDGFEGERQYAYVNMLISYWQSAYDLGEIDNTVLVGACSELFSSEPGRFFWRIAGPARIQAASSRRGRQFCYLVDTAYHKALEQPPAIPPPHSAAKEPALPEVPSTGGRGLTLLLAVGCGAMVPIALQIIYHVLRRIRMKF
ncbi:MAG: DUF6082 family protein [Pseudonocardiaceae bacterium]